MYDACGRADTGFDPCLWPRWTGPSHESRGRALRATNRGTRPDRVRPPAKMGKRSAARRRRVLLRQREHDDRIFDRVRRAAIGRAHVWTPVTTAPRVCRLQLAQNRLRTTAYRYTTH